MTKRKLKSVAQTADLSDLELEIMDIVWDLGECSSAEVIAEVSKKKKLADTTVRTVLANIRKKGYLEPVPTIERGYRLRPTIKRSKVARRTLNKLIGRLFHGSPGEAIVHLIKNEQVTEEELREIKKLIDEHDRGEK